jgi:hypothetical protein
MERRSRLTFGYFLVAYILIGIIPYSAIRNDGMASSNLVQLTRDPHYDRNPSILLADDGTYWLFFTRGRSSTGIRGKDGYDPDMDFYDIWYKRARSLEGLKWAVESRLPIPPPTNFWSAQRDVAAVQTHDGRIWVFSSPGYGPEGGDENARGILYYTYDRMWTGPFVIRPGTYNGCGIGHIDALEYGRRIWVIYDDCYTLKTTSLGLSNQWSPPITIAEKATLGKAIEADGTLYVAWVYIDPANNDWGTGIYLSASPNGTTWTQTADPVAAWGGGLTNWDPVLIKDRNIFSLFWAPSDAEQFIAVTSSRTPMFPGSWTSPARITEAFCGENFWWDFWPQPINKGRNEGGTLALLYTSERNEDGTAMIDGNIWLEMVIPPGIYR